MLVRVDRLARWLDTVTTARLTSWQATWNGDIALILGRGLPVVAGCCRFWGETVLAPLGYRPEPALPEYALLEAIGAAEDELVMLQENEVEVIERASFKPLSRSGVRRALGQQT
jgi:hypothetical protein